jgi:hypothetical protein
VAIMISLTLEGVPVEAAEEVNRRLDVYQHPPAGVIVHFAYQVGDAIRIVTIWTDERAHDAFDEVNDPPRVLAGVLAERGLEPPRLVSREVVEIQALVLPVP